MLPYLRSEIYRLRRRRMLLVLMILMALIPILIYVLIYTSTQAQLDAVRSGRLQPPGQTPVTEESVRRVLSSLRPDRAPEFALGMAGVVGAIFATILASSVMGNEFGWATVRTVLSHGGRRAAFVLAKLAALGLASALIVLAGFAGTFAAAYGVSIVGDLDLSLSGDVAARVAGYAARGVYVTLPYIAFAVLTAVLARSAAAGIAFGLVLLFGESLVGQLAVQLDPDLRPVFDAGIARNVSLITRTPSTGQGPPAPLPSPAEISLAVLILALYVVAFAALSVHRFAKRDLTLA